MRKKTKALSGASQDAYFRRALKAHPNLPAGEREQLVGKLRREVAQLRVRLEPRQDEEMALQPRVTVKQPTDPPTPVETDAPAGEPPVASVPFDPFSPNVVVVVRTSGRDAALAALGALESLDNLRLLAREQRLGVPPDLESAAELRAAIVSAAERRIANRIAAAS
jgi:hypothetical protein